MSDRAWTKERHETVKDDLRRGYIPSTSEVAAMLAEIERCWDEIERFYAPVDVEAEVERWALETEGRHAAICDRLGAASSSVWPYIVRPLVTDRARLAREVARLTRKVGTLRTMNTVKLQVIKEQHAAIAAARAEIARLTAQLRATVDRAHADTDALTAELAERTTERDLIRRWYSGARAEVIERCEEIRRLRTVEPTPPRALTEAEAQAWADRTPGDLKHMKALILAVDRGEIPPEVRPGERSSEPGATCGPCSAAPLAVPSDEPEGDAPGSVDPCTICHGRRRNAEGALCVRCSGTSEEPTSIRPTDESVK